jgi:hypothetical protein
MTWTNAFAEGACTVVVEDYAGSIFNGVLGLGDTSDPFNDANANPCTVSVSPDGQVSLQLQSGNPDVLGYALRVIPSYSLGTQGIRVSGITLDPVFYRGGGSVAFSDYTNSASVDLSYDSGADTWSPDPADLSALPSRVEMSIYSGQGVSS